MRALLEIAETFDVSRPVFRLSLERGETQISANTSHPVYRYRPEPEEGNLLSELVCDNYNESFSADKGKFVINTHEIAERAMQDIRSSFTTFLEKNLEMRNPRQSKIYRWYYRNLPNNSEFNDTLIMVYKYMRSFSDSSMKASDINHINNAIALLEAIMEKYEE